jgi:23S rRNA pseudouridine2605 synthase
MPQSPSAGKRIAKAISDSGLCSRREAERWIASGRVTVNGQTIEPPGIIVSDADVITVDGQLLAEKPPMRIWRYHKPRGVMTTHSDPQGRPTVFERVDPEIGRVISVGRLDFNSEGLLLLTNSGNLAQRLERPATGWIRRYRVRAFGSVEQDRLNKLRRGSTVDGVRYGPIDASLDRVQRANLWLTVSLKEGKNREIRKVLEDLGLRVNRLVRIAYGPFQLGNLKRDQVTEVGAKVLREQLGKWRDH